MLKYAIVATLLITSNVALACGGKSCGDCGDHGKETAEAVDISKAPGTHVALAVTGMKCGACSAKITKAIEAIEGVHAVSVSHEKGQAEVAFDEAKTDAKAFIAAIEKLSFQATLADAKQG